MPNVSCEIDGLFLPESPRWHEGELYFVDGPAIKRWCIGGTCEIVAQLECPVLLGLAFEADGSILTNDAAGRRLMRVRPGGASEVVADLSAMASTMLNEVTLLPDRTIYIGEIGFDVIAGEDPATARLIRIAPGNGPERVGPEIAFANGMADGAGATFYVAEFVTGAIWKVDASAGEPQFTRIASDLGMGVDGIAVGPAGRIWYADMLTGKLHELNEQGQKVRTIDTGFGHATSLAFGPDGKSILATMLTEMPSPESMGKAIGAVAKIEI